MTVMYKSWRVVALAAVLSVGVNAETSGNSAARMPTTTTAQSFLPAGSEEIAKFAELDQLAATMGVAVRINEVRINTDKQAVELTHSQVASCKVSGKADGISIIAPTCSAALKEFHETANAALPDSDQL